MRHLTLLAVAALVPAIAMACSSGDPSTPLAPGSASAAPTTPPTIAPTGSATTDPPPAAATTWDENLGRVNVESISLAADGDFIVSASNAGFAPVAFGGVTLDGTYLVARTTPQGKVRWAKAIKTFGTGGYNQAQAWARADGSVQVLLVGRWVDAGDKKHEPQTMAEQWVLVTYDKEGSLKSAKKVWETTDGCLNLFVDHREGSDMRFVCQLRRELVVGGSVAKTAGTIVMKDGEPLTAEGKLLRGQAAGLVVDTKGKLQLPLGEQGVTNFFTVGTELFDASLAINLNASSVAAHGDRTFAVGTNDSFDEVLGAYKGSKVYGEHALEPKTEEDRARLYGGVVADAKGAVMLGEVAGDATFGTLAVASSEGRGNSKHDLVVLQVSADGKASARVLARPGNDLPSRALTLLPDGRIAFASLRDDGSHLQVIERD